MRFRRLVTIMLTLSVVASLMALPVAAIDYSDVVAPLYIGLEDVTADLAISSNGYADCSGAAYVRSNCCDGITAKEWYMANDQDVV